MTDYTSLAWPYLNERFARGAQAKDRTLPSTPEALASATTERETDLGNAQRLVRLHGHEVRYVRAWRAWLVWDGTRWARDETGQIVRRAKLTVKSIYAEASRSEEAARSKALASHAVRSESEAHIRAMISLAESEAEVAIRPQQLDSDAWLFNVLNGTIDLHTGVLRAASPRDLITKLAPVVYDPAAEAPLWSAFLTRIFRGRDDLIRFLQRATGYSLTGDTTEQCLLFCYGTGANGKTTLLELVAAMLGDYAARTDFGTFLERRGNGPRNDIARLVGTRFAAANEMGEGQRLAEGLVKQLTGGDHISARFMYSEYFEFRPQFKLWLAANHKPTIRGTDNAIWRRIRLVPFDVTIPEEERDTHLLERLRAELPGILAWAVQGCLDWQREGLGLPPAVKEATAGYRAEMDVLAGFLVDRCTVTPGSREDATPLYRAYKQWCDETGERAVSQKAFGTSLKERGFFSVRGSPTGSTVWHGLQLLKGLNHPEPIFVNSPSFSTHEGSSGTRFGDPSDPSVERRI